MRSYSLGNICVSENIPINGRHRAKGDVEATVILFEKLLKIDAVNDYEVFKSFLNPRSREATLPPLLPKEVFDTLPEKHGVYYFISKEKDIMLVDVIGKKLLHKTITSSEKGILTLNLSMFKKGSYLLMIKPANQELVSKLIIHN